MFPELQSMAELTDYKGFQIVTPQPLAGDGGNALDNNFRKTADHLAETEGAHGATSEPTPSTIVERDADGAVNVTAIKGAQYVFSQVVPSAVWTIVHNLERFPSVTVTDSTGRVTIGDVQYLDNMTVEVTFTASFAGLAFLN